MLAAMCRIRKSHHILSLTPSIIHKYPSLEFSSKPIEVALMFDTLMIVGRLFFAMIGMFLIVEHITHHINSMKRKRSDLYIGVSVFYAVIQLYVFFATGFNPRYLVYAGTATMWYSFVMFNLYHILSMPQFKFTREINIPTPVRAFLLAYLVIELGIEYVHTFVPAHISH